MGSKKKTAKNERSFVNGLIKLGILVIAAIIAYNLVDQQIVLADKRKTLAKLEEQKQVLMVSNAEKKQLIEKSDQDEFVEKIAREYFGFAYPDEHIYIDISGR